VISEQRPYLVLDRLSKRFDGALVVDDVSLAVGRGEILALLGPSGSGKTTTLRMLAGFEVPDAGRVVVEGDDVSAVPPAARRFGMVFQHYALFPHLDVGENVAFGLRSLGIRGADLERRVQGALAQVDLAGYERRAIDQLSGGQQQRVALARALAPEPRVLLLDEPLSNLDPALRERTRRELRAVIRRVGITTILVTHEQDEAFDLADVVAVLRAGRLEQVGTPDELYQCPATPFVAGFVGRATSLRATLEPGTPAPVVVVEGARWSVPAATGIAPGPVELLVRPEGLVFGEPGAPGALTATVRDRRFAGALAYFTVVSAGGTAIEVAALPDAARVGDIVHLVPSGRGMHAFRESAT